MDILLKIYTLLKVEYTEIRDVLSSKQFDSNFKEYLNIMRQLENVW